jgi:hypothetical protein
VADTLVSRIVAREFAGEGWKIKVTADHAGVPASAITEELARAFAAEVHSAGGMNEPMRVAIRVETRDANTLAQLREIYSGTPDDVTLTIPTIEGDVIVQTLAGENGFSVLTNQRFIRMALALAFTDVPLPVEWISD